MFDCIGRNKILKVPKSVKGLFKSVLLKTLGGTRSPGWHT